MDELDFLNALEDTTLTELRLKMKTAGARDSVKNVLHAAKEWIKEHKTLAKGWAREHKKELAGGALGATALGAGTYAANKPKKKTGLSAEQELTRKVKKGLGNPSKKDTYTKALSKVVARASKEKADVAAKHPKKTAVIEGIPAGAALGALLTRKLTK